ncbi:hypothetical protein BH23CHL4_BH23CHL4_24090 [soil metagenome]
MDVPGIGRLRWAQYHTSRDALGKSDHAVQLETVACPPRWAKGIVRSGRYRLGLVLLGAILVGYLNSPGASVALRDTAKPTGVKFIH